MPEFVARHPRWTRGSCVARTRLLAPSTFLVRSLTPFESSRASRRTWSMWAIPASYASRAGAEASLDAGVSSDLEPEMAIRVLARLRARVPAATLVMAGEDKGLKGRRGAGAAAWGGGRGPLRGLSRSGRGSGAKATRRRFI